MNFPARIFAETAKRTGFLGKGIDFLGSFFKIPGKIKSFLGTMNGLLGKISGFLGRKSRETRELSRLPDMFFNSQI